MFVIDKSIKFPKVERVAKPDGRYYKTPAGKEYQSVTTFLGKQNQEWLQKWKKKVGEEEAARISKSAASRGTALHNMCEKYFNNDPDPTAGVINLVSVELFKQIKEHLSNHMDIIYGTEVGLYSDILQLAGTADLVGSYKNVPAIIDFKTSTKPKKEEWIQSYFLQAAAYSVMVEELTGLACQRLVIIIGVTQSQTAEVYEVNRVKYVHKLIEMIKQYNKENLFGN